VEILQELIAKHTGGKDSVNWDKLARAAAVADGATNDAKKQAMRDRMAKARASKAKPELATA
jgi:hypothetical protein